MCCFVLRLTAPREYSPTLLPLTPRVLANYSAPAYSVDALKQHSPLIFNHVELAVAERLSLTPQISQAVLQLLGEMRGDVMCL